MNKVIFNYFKYNFVDKNELLCDKIIIALK